jgi:PIN domain nuclease of toxin-antitoxin system
MTRLLDTQIVVWAAMRPERLPPKLVESLADTSEAVFVSSVSIAEVLLKQAIGKLELPVGATEMCAQLGFAELALTWVHAEALSTLPLIHRDPFDRLLLAQAVSEDLTLVTADSTVASYPGITVLEVT